MVTEKVMAKVKDSDLAREKDWVKVTETGSEKDSDSGWEMATDLGSAKGSVMEMEKD
jgi:hypothetical protein